MQLERTGEEGSHNTGRISAPGGPSEEGIHNRDGANTDATPDSEIQYTAIWERGDDQGMQEERTDTNGRHGKRGPATRTVSENDATANADIEATVREAYNFKNPRRQEKGKDNSQSRKEEDTSMQLERNGHGDFYPKDRSIT